MLNIDEVEIDSVEYYEVVKSKRKEFTSTIDSVSDSFKGSIYWYLSIPASRDIYISRLYERICKIIYINNLAENGCDEFITSDYSLYKCLKNQNTVCKIKCNISTYDLLKTKFQSLKLFLINVRRLFERSRARLMPKTADDTDIVMLDVFVSGNDAHGATINNKRYDNRYYGDLNKYTENTVNYKYLPVLFSYESESEGIDKIRNSNEPFIIPDDYLKLADYLKVVFSVLRQHFLRVKKIYIHGVDISSLINDELKAGISQWGVFNAFLYRISIKRMLVHSVRIKKFINLSENQLIDKSLVNSFLVHSPATEVISYKAFSFSSDFFLHRAPSKGEIKHKMHSRNVGLIGEGYIDSVKEYTDELGISICPAIRYADVYKEKPSSKKNLIILIALPMLASECKYIFDLVCQSVNDSELNDFSFKIRPHPMMGRDETKKYIPTSMLNNICISEKNLIDEIDDSILFVTNTSSSSMEALARGVPVIILKSSSNKLYNPIPDNVSHEVYQLCRNYMEFKESIFLFTGSEMSEKLNKKGYEIRSQYFEKVSKESVSNFLN